MILFLLFLICFRAKQLRFEKILSIYLTFKSMNALRKMIQSLVDYVLNNCFWILAVFNKFDKQELDYVRSHIWFALMLMRGLAMENLLLSRS